MVVRFLQKFSQSSYSLHKAALLIAALSLVAQALAVVRDKMLAHTFGAGTDLSLYYAAFRIPDMVYATLSSLMAAIIVLPFLTAAISVSQEKIKKVIDSLVSVFVIISIFVCTLLYIAMPYLTQLVLPGFSVEEQNKLTQFSRILLLSPLLLGFSNLLGSVLQLKKNFFFYSLAPVLYNLGIMLGVIFLAPHYGINGVLYGVVVGAVLHIAVQLPVAFFYGLAPKITKLIDWQLIREVCAISFPRLATLLSIQLAQTFLVAQASFISAGSVAVFSLAFNIQTVPLTLIGLSYAIAAFPVISEYAEKRDFVSVWLTVQSAMRHLVFWAIPLMCFIIVLRAHIVRILYGSGEFDWTDTRLTAAVLATMSIALTAQMFSVLLMRALYALKHSYTQLIAQTVAFFVTCLVAIYGVHFWNTYPMVQYFFESVLRITDVPHTQILMIGLAHASGAITLALGLIILFTREIKYVQIRTLHTVLGQSFGASIIGATCVYYSLIYTQYFISLDTFIGVFTNAIIATCIGGVAWFGILYILGSTELQEFVQALRKRFWKTDIVQEQLQEL